MDNGYYELCIYYHGFSSFKDRQEQCVYFDKTINELEKKMVSGTININSLAIADKVIQLALEHFGEDFRNWVNRSVKSNSYIGQREVEFLMDFMAFIDTGKVAKPFNFYRAVLNNKFVRFGIDTERRNFEYTNLSLPSKTVDVLRKVLVRENGMRDLILFMGVMFGGTGVPQEKEAIQIKF